MATTADKIYAACLDSLTKAFAAFEDVPPLVAAYQGDLSADTVDRWMQGHIYGVFLMTNAQTGVSRTTLAGMQETRVQLVLTVLIITKDESALMDLYQGGQQPFGRLEAAAMGALDGLRIQGVWQDLPVRFIGTSYPSRVVGRMFVGALSFLVEFVNEVNSVVNDEGNPLKETTIVVSDSADVAGPVEITLETSEG